MEDKEEKQRSLLGYTNGTHLQKFAFRESCKRHTDTYTKSLFKELL